MRIVGKGKNEDSNFVLFIIISFEKEIRGLRRENLER